MHIRQICVGIDAGKTRHQAAAYDVELASCLGQLSFTVGRSGFDQFSAFLQGLGSNPGEVLVGIEATGHYYLTLAEYLTDVGYQVVVLDPYRAARFRRWEATRQRLTASMLARWRFLALQPARTEIHPDTQLVALRVSMAMRMYTQVARRKSSVVASDGSHRWPSESPRTHVS